VSLVEVAGLEVLGGNPVGLVILSPLEFELSDLQEVTSSLLTFKVLPVNVDRSASDIGVRGGRSLHSSGA
jgi:hypothetical protein